MESKGSLKGVSKDWASGKFLLTFELDQDISGQIENLKDKLLRITAKHYRKKRSLDANAYYWVMVSQLAEAIHVSKPYMHNMMLRKYGQAEVIDGKLVYVVVPAGGEEKANEAEEYHIKPTAEVKFDRDGTAFRTYIMLKGSREYDSREMAVLIDGVVSECKELGIPTLPPDEIERIKKAWGVK